MAGSDPFPGETLSVFWGLPFLGILLTLSIAPLAVPRFWHAYYGRISLFWALATVVPIAFFFGSTVALHEVLHTYLLHYIPFIVLIGALYTISGGVKIDLAAPPSPLTNTMLLLCATLVASWIGTTGAAMMFIRPLLAINQSRSAKKHTVIFFILLVGNIGGSLTALGDPPLFLGFLNGIDFFWPTKALFLPFVMVATPLLMMYFLLDFFLYQKERKSPLLKKTLSPQKATPHLSASKSQLIHLSGKRNFIFLAIAIGAVLFSGLWDSPYTLNFLGIELGLDNLIRDIILVAMSWCSWFFGPKKARQENHFTWEPLLEVARLFAAIFITAVPVITILQAGNQGSLSSLVSLVSHEGNPVNAMYFWLTGLLSAFLDNAPTYLVFFNMAGGDASTLMGPLSQTLVAISAGSVFMGALTYIGNAPNFMVKAIAESKNVTMPGFFGYMLWASLLLLPLFLAVTFVLF